MPKINKSDLIQRVKNLPFRPSTALATEIVDTLLDAIQSEVMAGNKVALRGFGTFSLRQRAARVARNPRTGAEVLVAASEAT